MICTILKQIWQSGFDMLSNPQPSIQQIKVATKWATVTLMKVKIIDLLLGCRVQRRLSSYKVWTNLEYECQNASKCQCMLLLKHDFFSLNINFSYKVFSWCQIKSLQYTNSIPISSKHCQKMKQTENETNRPCFLLFLAKFKAIKSGTIKSKSSMMPIWMAGVKEFDYKVL